MSENTGTLTEALVEVRRAYRLVWAFQRRLFDLLNQLATELREEGLSLTRWDPGHASRPPRSSSEFYAPGYWAWDHLVAYRLHLSFDSPADRKGGPAHVWCEVHADTGFKKRPDREEPDVNDFRPEEESGTELRLVLFRSTGGSPEWSKAWSEVKKRDGARDGQVQAIALGEVTVTILSLTIDLATLADKVSVQKLLIEPVLSFFHTPTQ